jgi:Tat protein translocase TatB subunit
MFEVGFSEIVLIAIVALLVTDPKDLPDIMFKAGRFFRQFKMIMSRVSNTVSDVMHEFEVESYRQQYKDKKDAIEADVETDRDSDQILVDQEIADVAAIDAPSKSVLSQNAQIPHTDIPHKDHADD